jgi:AmiR/NasT family two-component response regulator
MTELSDAATVSDADFWRMRAEQLQAALESRIVIEQAKGMVAQMLDVDVDAAFEIIRKAARSSRRNIHHVAAEVIQSRSLPRHHP